MAACCIEPTSCVSGTSFELTYTGEPDELNVFLPHALASADIAQPYELRLYSPSLVTLTLVADIELTDSGEATVTVDLVPHNGGDTQTQTFRQTVPFADSPQAMTSTLQSSVPAGTYSIQGVITGPGTITVNARLDIQVIRSV